MRACTAVCASAAAFLVSAGAAQAYPIDIFHLLLDGLQETPPNASPGFGDCYVTLDTVTGGVSVTGTFGGLVAGTTAAHIHGLSPLGVASGVIVPLILTPLGGTAGTVSGSGVLTPAQVTGMIDGLCYVNIHSTVFPGGEIRGQTPAPGSAALLAVGGLAAMRRRRR